MSESTCLMCIVSLVCVVFNYLCIHFLSCNKHVPYPIQLSLYSSHRNWISVKWSCPLDSLKPRKYLSFPRMSTPMFVVPSAEVPWLLQNLEASAGAPSLSADAMETEVSVVRSPIKYTPTPSDAGSKDVEICVKNWRTQSLKQNQSLRRNPLRMSRKEVHRSMCHLSSTKKMLQSLIKDIGKIPLDAPRRESINLEGNQVKLRMPTGHAELPPVAPVNKLIISPGEYSMDEGTTRWIFKDQVKDPPWSPLEGDHTRRRPLRPLLIVQENLHEWWRRARRARAGILAKSFSLVKTAILCCWTWYEWVLFFRTERLN